MEADTNLKSGAIKPRICEQQECNQNTTTLTVGIPRSKFSSDLHDVTSSVGATLDALMGGEREAAAASTLREMATSVVCLIVMYVLFWFYGNAKRQQNVTRKADGGAKAE